MIVDDNEFDRYILKRRLRTCSFDAVVSEACDGRNAIEYLASGTSIGKEGYPPDIIFLDINMPRLNGFEFLEEFSELRKERGLAATVVVMFTSSPRQDDKDQASQWNFVSDFLIKGDFEVADLEEIVAQHQRNQAA